MKNRKKWVRAGMTFLLLVALLCGCGGKYEPIETSQGQAPRGQTENGGEADDTTRSADDPVRVRPKESDASGAEAGNGRETENGEQETADEGGQKAPEKSAGDSQTQAGTAAGSGSGSADASQDGGFSFADLKDWTFDFSSGAGGWSTELEIAEDGSFRGEFVDSDMGDVAEAYPNGTVSYSGFSGTFTAPEQVDGTTYRFRIASLAYDHETGEEIVDGQRWIYRTAYGLDDADILYLYLPGARVAALPQEYRDWIGYHTPPAAEQELGFYGLFNEKGGCGFSSAFSGPSDARVDIDELIAAAEAADADLAAKMQNTMTQEDLNELALKRYTTWDDALNTVWGILKEELDADAMQALTLEEREWITYKEQAAKDAGSGYADGSGSMAADLKAAELTRERVYVLIDQLE